MSRGRVCIAYAYLRYGDSMSIRDILESLVKQIIEDHEELSPQAEGLYKAHARKKTKPNQQELIELLSQFAQSGRMLIFVLDALDELLADHRSILVGILASLDAKILITSRQLATLQQHFPEAKMFDILAQASDIELLVQDFLRQSPDLSVLINAKGPSFRTKVVEAILDKSGGM
jgi:ankyrin repeat domain-containing protein 50